MMRGAIAIAVSIAAAWCGGCDRHLSIDGVGGAPGGTAGGGRLDDGGSEGNIIGGGGGIDGVAGAGGITGVGGNGGIGSIGGVGGNGGGPIITCSTGTGGRPAGQTAKAFSFQPPVDYPTGAGAGPIAVGDLDGDGKVDLAFLDSTAGVRVMLNQGNGAFGGPSNHAAGGSPFALALGDLNGDGRIDIAVLNNIGVGVLLNQGDASFSPPVNYVAGQSRALALGDLNGDGRLDIAVANSSNTSAVGAVAVLLNTGGGTFSGASYPGTYPASSIVMADLNGDCHPDLVVAGLYDGLSVLLNDGRGGFKPAVGYATGTNLSSIAISDLNGDGKADLVGVNDASAYVLFNYGNGTFAVPVGYDLIGSIDASAPDYPQRASLALADLDGDGADDMVLVTSCCGLVVSLNHGDGSFAPPSAYPALPWAISLGVADLNGDGQMDVAVVSQNNGSFPPAPASSLRVNLNASR